MGRRAGRYIVQTPSRAEAGNWRGFNLGQVVAARGQAAYADPLQASGARMVRGMINVEINLPSTAYVYVSGLSQTMSDIDDMLAAYTARGIRTNLVLRDISDTADGPGHVFWGNGTPGTVWGDATLRDSVTALWSALATRYAGDTRIGGFDLMNEPNPAFVDIETIYHTWAYQMIAAIRAADPTRTIIFPPAVGSLPAALDVSNGNQTALIYRDRPVIVPNMWYTLHHYSIYEITHQWTSSSYQADVQYPGVAGGPGTFLYPGAQMWDAAKIRQILVGAKIWQNKWGVPIWIGETSCARYTPNSAGVYCDGARQWLQDSIDAFREFGWGWAVHAFRESQPWNFEKMWDGTHDQTAGVALPDDLTNPTWQMLTSRLATPRL